MDTLAIFGVQLVLSLVVFALVAKWYVTPWLAEKPINEALIPLVFPHPRTSACRLGVFGSRFGWRVPAEIFCQHGCLR